MSPRSRFRQPKLPSSVLASIVALSAAPAAPVLPGTELVALHISNGAKMGQDLPKRIKLLNWGDNEILRRDPKNPDAVPVKDVVRVNATTLAALSANQANLGYDRVAFDFDHNSLPGHKNFEKNPRKVAAYGVPEVIENEGLFLKDLEYTPTGEQYAREYCDLSPAPLLNDKREVTFLHSAALCTQGAVVGLSFFSADFLTQPEALSTTTTTSAVQVSMSDDMRKLLIALFGCPDGASDDDILAAGKAFATKMAEAGGPEAMSVAVQLRATTDRLDGMERSSIIERAVLEGKIVPASAKTLAVADLRKIVADLPPNQVPLEQRTVALSASAAVPAAVESASADEIRSNCGVSKETWDKYYGPGGKLV